MDYERLKQFRTTVESLRNAPCPAPFTAASITALQRLSAGLAASDLVHELSLIDPLAHRYRVARLLPDVHNAAIHSVLSTLPRQLPAKGHHYLVQYSALVLDWRQHLTTPIAHAAHPRANHYTAQLEALLKHVRKARNKLAFIQSITAVVSAHEDLALLHEDLSSNWAQLRSLVTASVIPHVQFVTSFRLDREYELVHALLDDCDQFCKLLNNRDVHIPDIRTPLGKGLRTRLPSFLPEHEDEDGDEWDDVVHVVSTTGNDQNPESEEDEDAADADNENEKQNDIEWQLSNFAQKLENIQSSSSKSTSHNLCDKTSSEHNQEVLNKLEATTDSLRIPKAITKNPVKKSTNSVIERLRRIQKKRRKS